MAVLAAGERWAGLPFPPFDLFDWLARTLPGRLVTVGIDGLVAVVRGLDLGPTDQVAKLIEQLMALGLFGGLAALLGAAVWLARPDAEIRLGWRLGLVMALPLWWLAGPSGLGELLGGLWLTAVLGGWGATLGWATRRWREMERQPDAGRRAVLVGLGSGTVAAVLGGASLAGLLRRPAEAPAPATTAPRPAGTSGLAASPSVEVLEARFLPLEGTRPELTANPDFYRIDINTRTPEVDGERWRLRLDGRVERPLTLSLDELRQRPATSQIITLSCISNPVGGDLISTSRWRGVPLRRLLTEAGMQDDSAGIFVRAVDGFYETVTLRDALDRRTLLVFEMNGLPLPPEHGFPLRIYLPNRYGMKQPKWITRLEVIADEGRGYWVDRGWSREAIPHTTSVIDVARRGEDGLLEAAGIAWAGARGISGVEVQLDDRPWQAAELREPPLSPLTWVQWRHRAEAPPGRHLLRVRATDGLGNLQDATRREPHPNGATGLHERRVRI